MTTKSGRIEWLDCARGIAAMMVVIAHYYFLYPYHPEDSPGNFTLMPHIGQYGVHLFFIISGYVILMSVKKSPSPKKFLINRFSRLFPVYWTAVLLTFTLVALMGLPGREVTTGEMLTNLTMIHSFLGVPHVDLVYWTLTVEIMFYILVFILLKFRALNSINDVFIIIMFMLIVTGLMGNSEESAIRTLFSWYCFFAVGVSLYYLFEEKNAKPFIIISIIAPICIYINMKEMYVWRHFISLGLFFIIKYATIFHIRPLIFLGAISYPLYLTHNHIGYILIRFQTQHDIPFHVAAIVTIICMIILATILHYTIEKPVASAIRKRYLQKKDSL